MNPAMVRTTAGRPSLLGYLIRLYRSDLTLRSVADFAAIGTIVLVFIVLAPTQAPPTGGGTAPNVSGSHVPSSVGPQGSEVKPSEPQAKSAPRGSSSATAGVAPSTIPIVFTADVTNASLASFVIVDIDESAFASSSKLDQPRLAAAARAFRAERFADITPALADANRADPNVAFMLALAFVNSSDDDAKLAEPLLRAAANGGVRQATILLGRMLVRPPVGVARDALQGRQLIESAVAVNDRLAQRLAGIGYLTDDFGGLNPHKARDLFHASAQAGDAPATLFYAFMLGAAIGGPADQAQAADLLRRAAGEGLTQAQLTVGRWSLDKFKHQTIDDPHEGIEWLERAYKVGLSVRALQPLIEFYGSAGGTWVDKNKAHQLAQLCSGLRVAWCHTATGWQFETGVGTERDLIKAFAHYQVATWLGGTEAPPRLHHVDTLLKPDEREKATTLARTLNESLKPEPQPWHMQYVGIQTPPAPWAAARYDLGSASKTTPATSNTPPTTGESPPANQQVNRQTTANASPPSTSESRGTQEGPAQAPSNAAWVPISRRGSTTLNTVIYGSQGFTGKLKRLSANDWIDEVTDKRQTDSPSKYSTVSENLSELIVRKLPEQTLLRVDLLQRKIFVRHEGGWAVSSQISSIDPPKPVMRLPVPEKANEDFADHLDRYVEAQDEKAFAVGPDLHFSWRAARKTRDDATADALKACGSDCKLYAVGNDLVK